MPREPRINYSDVFYHVMARGDNREPLFFHERDYRVYRGLLRKAAERYRFEVHAFCLMPNHVHVLARSTEANLSRMMEWLQGIYARWFNKTYGRVGHVFQKRYLAKIVKYDLYLMEVGRYIHMNPVKPGLCRRPEEYPWSSLADYLSGKSSWIHTKTLLGYHGGAARFYEFTIGRADFEIDARGWPKCREWYLKRKEVEGSDVRGSSASSGNDAEPWIQRLAGVLGCQPEALRRGWRRDLVDKRGAALLALREGTTLSLPEIAAELGYRSAQSTSNTLRRARLRRNVDPDFQTLVEKVKSVMGGTYS